MFSWDPDKAISNFEKHRVSFEEAATVFEDVDGLDIETKPDRSNEIRRIRIGASIEERIIVVIYVIRRINDEKETIRIISSRPASRKERKEYARR